MKNIAIPTIKLVIITFISVFCFQKLHADIKLLKADINPLNRVIIYCSEKPTNYTSELSFDKTKITLKIDRATAVESAREIHGQGVVQDVYIQNFKNFAQVTIVLKDKRGYNANYLPLSQSLMVEIFDWSKLSPDEDDYRSGLLAYENGIINSAKKYFSKSFKKGNANAAGFLGLIELNEGRMNDALEKLIAAERYDSNIPDFYAALSQVYSLKNDKKNSDKYKNIYTKKSGLSNYTTMIIPPVPVSEDPQKQPVSYLDKMNDPAFIDSTEISKLDSIKSNRGNDSLAKIASKKQDTVIKKIFPDNSGSSSQMPPWLTKTAFYIAFASFLFIIMLISLYFRWRKQQITKIQKETTRKFSDKLRTAQTSMTGSAHAANLYKKTDKIIGDKELAESKIKTEKQNVSTSEVKQTAKNDNADDVQKIALEILASKASEFDSEILKNDDYTKESENIEPVQLEKKSNPRLELAMHLRDEQMKLKEKNIESLKKGEIPTDMKKLSEVAKKLGIEKSSLETKRTIANLESDKHSLQRLSEKFNQGNKNA